MQKNVLIIEDEIFISMVLEQTFANFGYNVLATIRYGEEVIDKLSEMDPKPDLITMDIH
ncbi:MAG: response regulator [Bacteroidia bacterium]|nr:response regulator [Bacteroidia bacterium]